MTKKGKPQNFIQFTKNVQKTLIETMNVKYLQILPKSSAVLFTIFLITHGVTGHLPINGTIDVFTKEVTQVGHLCKQRTYPFGAFIDHSIRIAKISRN